MQDNPEDMCKQSALTGPQIAIVGCGLIGQSWAIVFLRAGMRVVLYDQTEGVALCAMDRIKTDLVALEANGLLSGQRASACAGQITVAGSLEEAITGAAYIQESGPENLDIKISLTKAIDAFAAPDVPIGSSTSGLPASLYASDVRGRHRCLVVHPINPPHLIPLVEVVPASWTASDVVQTVTSLMQKTNQVPITLNTEIEGFVVNRLQGALLHEAFRLLEQGIASPRDIDSAISQGLGIRWSLMGPFETIHLNAPKGVADYVARFGPMYHNMFADEATRRLPEWQTVVDAGLAAQMDDLHPVADITEAQSKRDNALMKLLARRELLR